MFQKRMHIILISLVLIGVALFGIPALAQETKNPIGDTGSSEISFVITDRTLAELRKQELSDELLEQLSALKDTLFSAEDLFLNAVEDAIGQEALEQHQALILELAYVYDSTGRREPFKSAIEDDSGDPEVPTEPIGDECPPPLGKYDIGQFQIIGILLGQPGDRAKIKAPDGESYTITMDTCLGRYAGKVVTITENCVTIRETIHYKKGDDESVKEEDTELCLKTDDK